MFYEHIPLTCGLKKYAKVRWTAATINYLLDFTLELLNERYDALHIVFEEDWNLKKKEKLFRKVRMCYEV